MPTNSSRTIALTNRAPVKIQVDQWSTIAEARGDSYRGQDYARHQQVLYRGECDTYVLKVRHHADGRVLVYGILDAATDGDDWRGGEFLEKGADIPAAIRRVGEYCHLPDSIIRKCIADLPEEDLEMAALGLEKAPETDVAFTKAQGVLSQTERSVLGALTQNLPGSARGYAQVLREIDVNRVSWRGTAAELREVLREVIDHLAPDDRVMASPGFQVVKGQLRPTQTQKVRFVLRARRSSSKSIAVAEGSLRIVDEAVASFARMTSTRSSMSTHTATDANEVRYLKRYVDALLAELLEIS